MTTCSRNEVLLAGLILSEPELSHENHGIRFYRFFLQIPRLSGQSDTLPVLLPEEFLPQISPGERIEIRGQFRSFNSRLPDGPRLILTVYALEILPFRAVENQILLCGTLCKPPVFRRTPLGRSICDVMLAVPRRYGRADYLPVIVWGQLAVQIRDLRVGDTLSVSGRIQSRIYRKQTDSGPEERTAYEISVMHLTDDAEESPVP